MGETREEMSDGIITQHGITNAWWWIRPDGGASDPLGPFATRGEAESGRDKELSMIPTSPRDGESVKDESSYKRCSCGKMIFAIRDMWMDSSGATFVDTHWHKPTGTYSPHPPEKVAADEEVKAIRKVHIVTNEAGHKEVAKILQQLTEALAANVSLEYSLASSAARVEELTGESGRTRTVALNEVIAMCNHWMQMLDSQYEVIDIGADLSVIRLAIQKVEEMKR